MNKYLGLSEAAVSLCVVKLLRLTVPLKRWSRFLGEATGAQGFDVDGPIPTGIELDISVSLARAAYRLPGTFTCFDQSAAGQLIMRRRHLPSAVVIGLRAGNKWDAHAWLVGETGVLAGGGDAGAGLVPVSAFTSCQVAGKADF
jgi:hypothetical protein